jgi:hypothetical protein
MHDSPICELARRNGQVTGNLEMHAFPQERQSLEHGCQREVISSAFAGNEFFRFSGCRERVDDVSRVADIGLFRDELRVEALVADGERHRAVGVLPDRHGVFRPDASLGVGRI